MDKYEPLIKPEGVLVVNTSLVPRPSERTDIRVISLPASDIATELGNVRMANLVALGALLKATGIVNVESVLAQLDEHLSERQRKWLEPNKAALLKGAEFAQ